MGKIICADGTEKDCPYASNIPELIGSRTGLVDVVRLRHLGEPMQVMMVDDTGYLDNRPVNAKATELYHLNCRAGTTFPICGDVWVGFDGESY